MARTRKRTLDVVKDFVEGKCSVSHTGHVESYGDRLYSYSTCIAERLSDGNYLLNLTKYSVTTSKHQGYVVSTIKDVKKMRVIDEVVPRGAVRLAIRFTGLDIARSLQIITHRYKWYGLLTFLAYGN
jgi:hypothetical protein